MHLNEITSKIIECSIKVHTILGPGLMESSYEECLEYEFTKRNVQFDRQRELPITYEGKTLSKGYRVDFLVENSVIVEIKAVDMLNELHHAQMLTYLKLSGCKCGLIINFNVSRIKYGIKRLVNGI